MVANAKTIKPSEDPGVLAVEADLADPGAADLIISETLDSFGRTFWRGICFQTWTPW